MKKLVAIIIFMAGMFPAVDAANAQLSFYQQAAAAKGKNQKQDRAFASALARDVAQWVVGHEESAEVKNALLMQAGYHQRAEEYAAALVALYQVRFYFPFAQDLEGLSSQIDSIMENLNRNQKGQALKLLAVDTSEIEGLQARRAALLQHLVQADLKDIYEPVSDLFENYFTRYPQDGALDKMILLYGDWQRQNGNFLAAIMEYKKVYELFPATVYKAAGLRMTADVYAFGLKEYEIATSLYNQVLKDFPGSAETGVVYKHLAVVEENQKNYSAALTYYDKAIAELGAQPAAFEAWQGKADVLVKTKDFRAAYDVLLKGAALFANHETQYISLLEQAAEIAERKLKNPALQTAALDKILLTYPQTHRAPEFLYDSARAYEKQGKNTQAIQLYKQIIIHYPTDKYANRAQGRLSKLEK